MSTLNNNLHKAKKEKNDEFYTQLTDIEKELKYYREHFKGKVVYCNCDDAEESNFWRYFSLNFEFLGLKKLVSTHFSSDKPSYKLEIVSDINGDGVINRFDTVKTPLKQNGDFRSKECIDILKTADIVVTNPPFSLFREYITQLDEYNKKFLIVGNQNAITYKETFNLIKENKLWLGVNSNKTMYFEVPDDYPINTKSFKIDENGVKFIAVSGISWFTNLDNKKRNENLILYKKYNENTYPKYDNYDAINVDKTKDIPMDYDGYMGVPITFLDKYNPKQFKICGIASGRDEYEAIPIKKYIEAKQHNLNGTISNGSKINTGPALICDIIPDGVYYTADNVNGYIKILYARIIIKNLNPQK